MKIKVNLQSPFFEKWEDANEFPQKHIMPDAYDDEGISKVVEGYYYYYITGANIENKQEYEEDDWSVEVQHYPDKKICPYCWYPEGTSECEVCNGDYNPFE